MHIAAATWTALAALSSAQPAYSGPATPIYTCVDSQGRRLSADRPIPECASSDQRLLNRDGSVRAVVPPATSPEEATRLEISRRAAEQARAAREAEARRDRLLLARYPDQAPHDAARARAQEPVSRQAEAARRRLAELEEEGQALRQERDAVAGKALPPALHHRLAANEGAIEAQLTILRAQEAERDRLNRQFDLELARLRALWAGAAPGALGPLGPPGQPSPGASPVGR